MSVAGLPGVPQSVSVREISPTTVLLDIQPPLNTGGVDIYGYRVQYLLKIDDFMIGIFCSQFCVLLYLCSIRGTSLIIEAFSGVGG